MKVGLIGVGTMGSRMAQRLLNSGFEVYARDVDASAEQRARQTGARVMESPAEVAKNAEIILLSLPRPADVALVVGGGDGLLAAPVPGQVIVDLSTVDPFTTQAQASLAGQHGVGYLDAPVLGRPQGCGNWTLPVGGEGAELEKCRPVLGVLAKKVVHVGPSGHGNLIKLLNNMMFGAINAVTAEIIAICHKAGMDPRVLYNTISQSGAASVSNLFLELGPKMLGRDFSPLFTVDLLHKDLELAITVAKRLGVPLLVGTSNQLCNELARSRGLGAEDTSAVIKVYEDLLGIEVGGETGASN